MEEWCADLDALLGGEMSDSEVSTFIQKHTLNKDALAGLFQDVPRAEAVFRELCASGQLPMAVCATLRDLGKFDLAFQLCVGNEAWDLVVDRYSQPFVSSESRKLAFDKLLLLRQWSWVFRLISLSLLESAEVCLAFQTMIHVNDITLAAEMHTLVSSYGRGIRIPDHLLLEAMDVCLRSDHFACAVFFMIRMEDLDPGKDQFIKLVKESLKRKALHPLLRLIQKRRPDVAQETFWRRLFTAVLTSKNVIFKKYFCSSLKDRYPNQEIQTVAVEVMISTKHFTLLKDITCYCNATNVSVESVFSCLKEMTTQTEVKIICGPLVEFWFQTNSYVFNKCSVMYQGLLDDILDIYDEERLHFIDSLFEDGYCNAAFFLCLVFHHWSTAKTIIEENMLSSNVFVHCFGESLAEGNREITILLMHKLEIRDCRCQFQKIVRDKSIPSTNIRQVLLRCDRPKLADWALLIVTARRMWNQVRSYVYRCRDEEEAVTVAMFGAADHGDWDEFRFLAYTNLESPALNNAVLLILYHSFDNTARAERLEETCTYNRGINKYLHHEIFGLLSIFADNGHRSGSEKLRHIIKTGIFSHPLARQPCRSAPLVYYGHIEETALVTALLALDLESIKLLYKVGAANSSDMRALLTEVVVADMEEEERTDILEYLKEKASTVRSLQDLCRQSISPHIGFGPGRVDRAMSLPLTMNMQEYILYKDCEVCEL